MSLAKFLPFIKACSGKSNGSSDGPGSSGGGIFYVDFDYDETNGFSTAVETTVIFEAVKAGRMVVGRLYNGDVFFLFYLVSYWDGDNEIPMQLHFNSLAVGSLSITYDRDTGTTSYLFNEN